MDSKTTFADPFDDGPDMEAIRNTPSPSVLQFLYDIPEDTRPAFPSEYWTKGKRTKIAFGRKGTVLTLTQARKRKLVRWDLTYHVYVRSCSNPYQEDRRIEAYERRIAKREAERQANNAVSQLTL